MLLQSVNDVFDSNALRHALFYKHAPALRFELAQGEAPLDRFSQAYDRARSLASRAFDDAEQISVILGMYGDDKASSRTAMLRAARACGIQIPASQEYAVVQPEEGIGEELERLILAFEVGVEVLPRLLWGVLAQELGVRPRLLGDMYLANVACGVLLHPYDDRGMDAIGPNTALLSTLYQEFQGWLLKYDIKQMAGFFSSTDLAGADA